MTDMEKHREDSLNFRRKLFDIQEKVKFIQNNARGQFTFLDYYGLMNKLDPLLKKNGLYMSFSSCDHGSQMACLLEDVETGNSTDCRAPFPKEAFDNKNAMSSYGKKITYIRRYLVCMMFNIVTADDNGESFGEDKEATNPKKEKKELSDRDKLITKILYAVKAVGLSNEQVSKIIEDNITVKFKNKTRLTDLNEAELAFVLITIEEYANGGSK